MSEDAKIVILSVARSAKPKDLHFASVASLFLVVKSPIVHDVILNEVKDLRFASVGANLHAEWHTHGAVDCR